MFVLRLIKLLCCTVVAELCSLVVSVERAIFKVQFCLMLYKFLKIHYVCYHETPFQPFRLAFVRSRLDCNFKKEQSLSERLERNDNLTITEKSTDKTAAEANSKTPAFDLNSPFSQLFFSIYDSWGDYQRIELSSHTGHFANF